MTYCPKHALKVSESYNSLGIHPMMLDDEEACGGCTFCAVVCPDAAIEIKECGEEK
jgi:2-oxoglutarate ferredoxin oxidoreductase subunit delta